MEACLPLAKDACSGRKGAAACPGSLTGAAGRVDLALARARWLPLDLGLQNTQGEAAAALLLAAFVSLISVLREIPAAEGKHLGWISLRMFARPVPWEWKMRIFPVVGCC